MSAADLWSSIDSRNSSAGWGVGKMMGMLVFILQSSNAIYVYLFSVSNFQSGNFFEIRELRESLYGIITLCKVYKCL